MASTHRTAQPFKSQGMSYDLRAIVSGACTPSDQKSHCSQSPQTEAAQVSAVGAVAAHGQWHVPPPAAKTPRCIAHAIVVGYNHGAWPHGVQRSGDGHCFFVGWHRRDVAREGSHHSGMFPCLRRGSSSRLVRNIRRPATIFWRVSAGSITSSMYPRSAAAYGLAYFSV